MSANPIYDDFERDIAQREYTGRVTLPRPANDSNEERAARDFHMGLTRYEQQMAWADRDRRHKPPTWYRGAFWACVAVIVAVAFGLGLAHVLDEHVHWLAAGWGN